MPGQVLAPLDEPLDALMPPALPARDDGGRAAPDTGPGPDSRPLRHKLRPFPRLGRDLAPFANLLAGVTPPTLWLPEERG